MSGALSRSSVIASGAATPLIAGAGFARLAIGLTSVGPVDRRPRTNAGIEPEPDRRHLLRAHTRKHAYRSAGQRALHRVFGLGGAAFETGRARAERQLVATRAP